MPDYSSFGKIFKATDAPSTGGALPPIPEKPPEPVKPQASWLPQYDERVPERTMFHGSNSESISGSFEPGKRDSGWFGQGMYATMYPDYAARWGETVHAAPVPDIKYANVWTDSQYKDMSFDEAAKRAHESAGGHEGWINNERAYSKAFRDALMSEGVQGVRVGIGGRPDAEIVIFDPDTAGVQMTPFASRLLGHSKK
jgi:hypothetical protein